MKKFVMGLIVGAAVMAAGTAWADTIGSLIGKTIQGQFPVTVDGQALEMPAIVVDGTSFLPVRSFGESVGYAVYFDTEGAVRLEKQATAAVQASPERQAEYDRIKAAQRAKQQEIDDKIKAEQDAVDARREQLNAEYEAGKKEEQERLQQAQAQ